MVREFRLPDVGEGVREGEIVQWLVEEGESIAEDQPVVEVETDKALVEIPSPVEGTVREILVEEGEIVPVGDVIITFDVAGENAVEPEEKPEKSPESSEEGMAESDVKDDRPGGDRVFAAPSVRRLARELGVDIHEISGSGPSGRITEADVRNAAEPQGVPRDQEQISEAVSSGEDAAVSDTRPLAVPAARRMATESGIDLSEVPATGQRNGERYVTVDDVQRYLRDVGADEERAEVSAGDRIPYRGIRRTIGEAMVRSAFTIPHVTHHDDVDVTRLIRTRKRLSEKLDESSVKLTYMPFVMKAVVAGLKAYPTVNSSLDEENEEILIHDRYNIGIATATDRGLLVPVIRDVDTKGVVDLAAEIDELVSKARDKSISRDEMKGGTFTITNFGAIGGSFATPIINYPEVAILGLGAIDSRPRVHEGEVVPRSTLPLSLSIDHRVIDGAIGASFVNEVKQYLEEPALLLID